MSERVYNMMELVGTSEKSIEQAINNALEQAAKKQTNLDWFQVVETRGFIDKDKTKYYQVHLKIGYYDKS